MEEFKKQVEQMSNEDLLADTMNLAGGDDYDGCFTLKGLRQFEILENELNKRLVNCGFLKDK